MIAYIYICMYREREEGGRGRKGKREKRARGERREREIDMARKWAS
jgi:hypothetical protein